MYPNPNDPYKTQVQHEARPMPQSPGAPNLAWSGGVGAENKEERTWALVAHLSTLGGYLVSGLIFLGPLIIWLIKKDDMPFAAQEAKEDLNFTISMSIYYIVSIILMFVLIGIVPLLLLPLFHLIVSIMAAVKSNEGIGFRYPLTIRFIK